MADVVTATSSFASAYDGARVVVTGHTGFKGAWLSLWLHRLGASVVGLSTEPPTEPSLHDASRLGEIVDWCRGDVTDADHVRKVIDAHRPDVVFHLAAQPIVLASYADPLSTFATNVMGTANVLDAVRRTGTTRATVVVTTDKCYETNPTSPAHRESDRLGGEDPYSASKACAELVTRAFRSSFDLPELGLGVATVRAGNIIGGGDWAADRIIPDCARALESGDAVRLRHPEAVRPWQHVVDALAGYLALGARLIERPDLYSEAWNFGPDPAQPYTVAQAAEVFADACAEAGTALSTSTRRLQIERVPATTPFEQPTLRLDPDKAAGRLGWHPLLDFTTTIEWAASWYRDHATDPNFDARAATLSQIADYERLATEADVWWAPAMEPVR